MKQTLVQLVKNVWFPKVVVLLYHRVAQLEQDIWNLAVTPEHFEAQLQVLKKTGRVISLPELLAGLAAKKLKQKSIVITFDDGYADNFHTALPLLERFGLPATFFITSHNIGTQKAFWWDQLAQQILGAPMLPPFFNLQLHGQNVNFALEEEAVLSESVLGLHQSWDASTTEPPTRRSALFLQLWAQIRQLQHKEQEQMLAQISEWIGTPPAPATDARSMSEAELRQMAAHPLCTIGAHTANHPALSLHEQGYQYQQIVENKAFLEQKTGRSVTALAYPYGAFNEASLKAAQQAGMQAAFTTNDRPFYARSHPLMLGRFEVGNWNGGLFEKKLNGWFRKSL